MADRFVGELIFQLHTSKSIFRIDQQCRDFFFAVLTNVIGNEVEAVDVHKHAAILWRAARLQNANNDEVIMRFAIGSTMCRLKRIANLESDIPRNFRTEDRFEDSILGLAGEGATFCEFVREIALAVVD